MIYDDLTNYTHGFKPALSNVFNVGWLGDEVNFPTGKLKPELILKLKELAYGNSPFSSCFRVARGFSSCNVCKEIASTEYKGEKKIIGDFLLLIPSVISGEYFAFPSTLIHSIERHHYLPPKVFIDSLENLDLRLDFSAENFISNLMDSSLS